MEFRSFDKQAFLQAINDHDFRLLKTYTAAAISYDPTFKKGEAQGALNALEKRLGDSIFEAYQQADYEERLEPEQWDQRYFSKLVYWFEENFARERIDYIKQVGQAVFKDVVEEESSPAIIDKQPAKQKKEAKSPLRFWPVAVALTGVLVLAIILILKFTR